MIDINWKGIRFLLKMIFLTTKLLSNTVYYIKIRFGFSIDFFSLFSQHITIMLSVFFIRYRLIKVSKLWFPNIIYILLYSLGLISIHTLGLKPSLHTRDISEIFLCLLLILFVELLGQDESRCNICILRVISVMLWFVLTL